MSDPDDDAARFFFTTPEGWERKLQRHREHVRARLLLPDFERYKLDRMRYTASASRAEYGVGAAWDDVAFLREYGTVQELTDRCRQLGGMLATFPSSQPADVKVHEALDIVMDRMAELLDAAERVEGHLRESGWEFDADTRRIRSVGGAPGRPRDLVAEWAGEIFDFLTEIEGWEKANTAELREAIRESLANIVPAEYLSTGRGSKIHSAVNARLNAERHY